MCSPQVRYILLIKSCHTKDYIYKHRIFCFSVWNTKLRRKNKDWLSRNHDNVSECDDFSTHFSEPPYNNSTKSLAMTQRKRQNVYHNTQIHDCSKWRESTSFMCHNLWWFKQRWNTNFTPNEHFDLYHGDNKLHSMIWWWWYPLCTKTICLIECW